MRTRESGMPEESLWSSFFSVNETLTRLGLTSACGDAVDFGCGYGTFTIAAARIVRGKVYGIDIDPNMVRATCRKAHEEGLTNVIVEQRDFMSAGAGLADGGVDYAMLFNILHCEQPEALLAEAWRVLKIGGSLGVIHWKYDASTPRGPSMNIRPRSEQCLRWAERVGFHPLTTNAIELPPYHYGLTFIKP